MSVSRYARTPVLELGRRFGTSNVITAIRRGIADGTIPYEEMYVRGYTRLDKLAFDHYGEGRDWWMIAAASGIGWAPQVAPGTYIRIPEHETVLRIVG